MNFRIIRSLVLVLAAVLFGACAGPIKMLPDGQRCLSQTTVGDSWDRSASYTTLYECRMEGGKMIVGREIKPGDMSHGQTVGGQLAVGAMGGVGAAVVNGHTASKVADKQCKSNCGGPAVVNNVQSVANALNENKVNIGVNSCSTGTCGQ